jgi:hypothetical protein
MRLVTVERTRAIVSLDELRELSASPEEITALVNHLAQARLLVIQGEGGGATVEIVHESLIHSWPKLLKWLDESHDDSAFLEQLRTASKQWQGKNYDAGLLWRGDTAEEARRWRSRYRGKVPQLQQAFLDHVFAHADRAVRRKRMAVVAAMTLLLALVAAAAIALVIINDSRNETRKQAVAAKKAEKQAVDRLAEVQEKEQQRRQEEELKRAAERQAATARAKEAMTNEELQKSNAELLVALSDAEKSEKRAKRAQEAAEDSMRASQRARREAEDAKRQTERLLASEKARVRKLREQIGGGDIIDTLK